MAASRDLESDADEVLRLLQQIVKSLRQAVPPSDLEQALTAVGLTDRHLSALVFLAASGPMTVREFAEALGIAPASASLMVSDLSRNGFIVRREDAQDLRRRILSIAPDHQISVDEFRRSRATVVERALQGASDRDRATFIQLLGAIAQTSGPTDTSGRG